MLQFFVKRKMLDGDLAALQFLGTVVPKSYEESAYFACDMR